MRLVYSGSILAWRIWIHIHFGSLPEAHANTSLRFRLMICPSCDCRCFPWYHQLWEPLYFNRFTIEFTIFSKGCFVLRPILSEEVFVLGHLDVVTPVESDAATLFIYAAQKGTRSSQLPGRHDSRISTGPVRKQLALREFPVLLSKCDSQKLEGKGPNSSLVDPTSPFVFA